MSNGSRLRRDRAHRATAHHPHAPHSHEPDRRGAPSLIPACVRVSAPHCGCGVPMVLIGCRCCGSMHWECFREPTPHGHVRVKVLPVDDLSDLLATDPPATAAATPAEPG